MISHQRVVGGGAVRAASVRFVREEVEAHTVRRRRESARGELAQVDLKHQNHHELLQEREILKRPELEEGKW